MPPPVALFRQYRYSDLPLRGGIVETNGIKVLISNGVGTSALPVRFFARPQFNVIILEK